jgi:hypothetical protein
MHVSLTELRVIWFRLKAIIMTTAQSRTWGRLPWSIFSRFTGDCLLWRFVNLCTVPTALHCKFSLWMTELIVPSCARPLCLLSLCRRSLYTHELPRCNLRIAFVIQDVLGTWASTPYSCDRNEAIPTREVFYLTMLSVAKIMFFFFFFFLFFFFPNATMCSYELSWFPSWLWR